MIKFYTIAYLEERIQWLNSQECTLPKERKEKLILMAKNIKAYMEKEGLERIKVCPRNRDFGKKGFEIAYLN